MRISTSQIYDAGSLNIQRNQAALFKLQNQLSTGRRVLTPEDDPVAAAQALLVTQAKEMNTQQTTNQGTAESQLGLVDSQLSSLVDLIQNVRDRVIQAGNSTLSASDRQSIATELEARFGELLGLANAQNGSGDYLFSGYQGATKPFAINASESAVSPATTSPVGYYGDDGERLLQVSSSRLMAVNVAGSDVFMDAKQGNGIFVVKTGGNGAGINLGSATADSGSVLDLQKWQAAVNLLPSSPSSIPPVIPTIQIQFSKNATTGATEYQLFDATPTTRVAVSDPKAYTSGMAIPLVTASVAIPIPPLPAASTLPVGTNFGSQVVIQGNPEAGDTFNIQPSTNQSLFQTMQSLIGILKTPVGTSSFTTSEYTNQLGQQLTNLDRALDNVSSVQATVGTRMREIESLGETASDLNLQYQTTLSDLQDLDYAEAISNFTMQQTYLEAAQISFALISGLSLFNYL